MKMRKFIAMILAASLVLSQVSMTAYADVENEPETKQEITEEAIEESIGESIEKPIEETKQEITEEATESETQEAEQADEDEDEDEGSGTIVLTSNEVEGIVVKLKANAAAFPDNDESELKLSVQEVTEEDAEAASEELEEETEKDNVAKRVTYDIKVMDGDEEVEPEEEVKVEFALTELPSGADAVKVYHHEEDGDIDTVASKAIKDADKEEDEITVKVETESFSLYTVDFTYEDKTVSIAGDTEENKLSDILEELGITEDIEDVEVYQDDEFEDKAEEDADGKQIVKEGKKELFSVYEEGNEWYVDAVNAFSSEHGIKVKTANGEYEIKVTDAVNAGDVCKIDDTGYKTLTAAITAASTSQTTITMVASISEYVNIQKNQDITLDLNGYVLKGAGSRVITNNGKLTITDSNTDDQTHYFNYSATGAWTLNDDASSEEKNAAISISEITSVTATSTLIKVVGGCITGGKNESYAGGGVLTDANSSFTMTGGNICGNNAKQGGGLYAAAVTAVKLENVNIIGNHAVSEYGGMLFNANKGNSFTVSGTVKICNNTAGNATPRATESNIVVWDANAAPVTIATDSNLATDSEIGIVLKKSGINSTGALTTNGTEDDEHCFFSDDKNYTVAFKTDHLEIVERAKICQIGDVKYTDVQDAVDAVKSGETIKLLEDINLTKTITIANTVPEFTLDLNGKTLDGTKIEEEYISPTSVIENSGELTIKDTATSSQGKITGGHGIMFQDSTTMYGGGICNMGTLTLEGGIITGNNTDYGGGICNLGTLTLSNVNISSNSADHGGGIYNVGALIVTGGNIVSNSAYIGGGIYNAYGSTYAHTATLSEVGISDNNAKFGGGIYNCSGSTLTVLRTTINNNQAQGSTTSRTGSGGGIGGRGTIRIENSIINGNHANIDGGGIGCLGNVEIKNSAITNNSAVADGGGICNCFEQGNSEISLKIYGTVIKGNTAGKQAGGIYCNGHLTVDGTATPTEIINNTSGSEFPSAGVYHWTVATGSVAFSGKVIIKDNTTSGKAANLCLSGGTAYDLINISGLTSGSDIGISLMINDSEENVANKAAFSQPCASDYSAYFRADRTDYWIENEDGNILALYTNETNTPSHRSSGSSKASVTYYGSGSRSVPARGSWVKNSEGKWNFGNKGITKFTNIWGYIQSSGGTSSNWYYFDANGNMLTGWQTINGKKYYFCETKDSREGIMETGWKFLDGKWYCFATSKDGNEGALLTNTTTPDGFKVDANGVWIQE